MTTPIQPPPLDVRRYYVEELIFRALREYDAGRTMSSAIDVDFNVQQDEVAPLAYRITMRIQLAPNGYTEEENAPYSIDFSIVGDFTFAEGTADEVAQRMIYINGPSILFGIARGITGQATGASKHGQFVLPTVNFVEIEKARMQRVVDDAERQIAENERKIAELQAAPPKPESDSAP
jgi:preprotein translocase subunit SecB